MRFKKQKGFALLTIIIAIVMMTALGAGIYTLTTSSTFSELLATRDYNAYQLAKSGLRYAAFNSALSPEGTYNMSDGQSFTITSTTVGGLKQYQSVGNVNQGSFLAANRKLAYNTNVAAALTPPIIDLGRKDNYTINPIPGTFPTSPIVFNEISPGSAQNTVTLGNNTNDAYGNIVYQGAMPWAHASPVSAVLVWAFVCISILPSNKKITPPAAQPMAMDSHLLSGAP